MGIAYAVFASFQSSDTQMFDLAKAQLAKAEELDPRLALIHVGRSTYTFSRYGNWDLRAAIIEGRTAQRLDPNAGHSQLASFYWHSGLETQGARHMEAALRAEPNNESNKELLADYFYIALRVDEGAAAEKRLLYRGPRAAFYLTKELIKEAAPLVEKAYGANPANLRARIDRAHLLALQGEGGAARREIDSVEIVAEKATRLGTFHHVAYGIARVRARLGDAAEAAHWLQITADTGFPQYPMMERDHMLDPVRKHPDVAMALGKIKARWEALRQEFGE